MSITVAAPAPEDDDPKPVTPVPPNVAPHLSVTERKAELEIKLLENQLRVVESIMNDDYAFGGSDLLDDLRRQTTDANGTWWAPSNIPSDRRGGANWPIWRTERELGDLRQKSRVITQANSYAGGLLRNLTAHVIGKGGTYKTKPVKDAVAPTLESGEKADLEALAKDVQTFIDDHNKKNRWNCGNDPRMGYQAGPTREQEIFRRVFRDGESIVRAFLLTGDEGNPDNRGRTFWRFVEPACVRNGPGCLQHDGWFLGMKHRVEPYEDVEDVQAYWCEYLDKSLGNQEQLAEPQGEEVPADKIVHAKNPDEDAMIGRGTPFFAFDTFDAFYRAGRLQRAISIGATLRACRAEMWEHQVATQAQISNLAAGRGVPVQNRDTGRTEAHGRMSPGQIVDGPASRKLVQPIQGQVTENLDAAQGDLRQAASAACAPEYMVSADASNANYASTKEAGTPFVRWAELLQEHFKSVFLACIWKAVRWAVECKILPPEAMDLIEITVELPKVTQRDPLQSAQEDAILIEKQIKDPQTASAERGLDPDAVEQNFLERQESMGMQAGGPGGGFGQMPPAGGGSPFGGAGGGQDDGVPTIDANPKPALPHPVMESLADVASRLAVLESAQGWVTLGDDTAWLRESAPTVATPPEQQPINLTLNITNPPVENSFTLPPATAPTVTVDVPQQPAPVINVQPSTVEVQNSVTVPTDAIKVTVEQPKTAKKQITIEKGDDGKWTGDIKTE